MATAPVTVPIGLKAVPIPPFPDKASPPLPADTVKKSGPAVWPIVIALTAGAIVVAALWRK